ncbi:MAG: MFS transporter [Syntrophomonadaceae bacterium]|jgi:MFS family permease|nr:MFS transporter [Syntrophomonadaceae bacterium]
MMTAKLPFKKLLSGKFLALAHSNFRYFLSGQGISLLGTWMQRTAQQWLIYSLTGSAFLLGLLGVCQQLPILLFSLFSGVYIDKYPKKKILLVTQAFQMAQALTMAALVGLGMVKYWHIFILAAMLGLSNTIDMPARQTFFIELVGRRDLKNAIGLNATVENTAKIVGPGLAGIIMAKYGVSFCFLLNGLSFIAVIYSLTRINHYDENIRMQRQPVISEIINGLKYIKNKDVIFYAIISTAIIGIFAMNTNVIFPVFARVTFNQQVQGFSFMLSAMGIGALIGSMIFAARSQNQLSYRSVLINALLLLGSLIVAGSISNYYIVLVVIAIIGVFNITFMTTVNSILQLNSSDDYRGRVMSVYYLVLTGSSPIGNFATGYVAEHFGPANSFYFGGLMGIGLISIFFLSFMRKKKSGLQNGT